MLRFTAFLGAVGVALGSVGPSTAQAAQMDALRPPDCMWSTEVASDWQFGRYEALTRTESNNSSLCTSVAVAVYVFDESPPDEDPQIVDLDVDFGTVWAFASVQGCCVASPSFLHVAVYCWNESSGGTTTCDYDLVRT